MLVTVTCGDTNPENSKDHAPMDPALRASSSRQRPTNPLVFAEVLLLFQENVKWNIPTVGRGPKG